MALLDQLAPDDRELLLSLQEERVLPAGTLLFRQGDPADSAIFVNQGELALELYAPGLAAPVEVYRSQAGDLIGEPALVAGGWRSRTAVATRPTRIGVLHRVDLKSLLSSFHPASLRIVLAVARHVVGRMQAYHTPSDHGEAVGLDGRAPVSHLDPLPFLPCFPFFSDFTRSDLDALLELGELYDVERGTELVRDGQRASFCYLVVRGAVDVRQQGQRIALLGPGRPAGEMAPLTGRPTAADLVMRESGTLLELGRAAFTTLTTPGERVAYKFTNALASTLMETLARTNLHRARQALHPPLGGR